ncbi:MULTISPECIES: DUF2642 domain-containing protein [Bacillaceae]|nr:MULTISPECIES: DUF2642 domain-containing protein [Bacillaceae]
MYRQNMQPMNMMQQPEQVIVVEPFVYNAASSLVGKRAVIETSRGRISGSVIDVKPDHIALQERDSTFFVRLCEVVWIMPDTTR